MTPTAPDLAALSNLGAALGYSLLALWLLFGSPRATLGRRAGLLFMLAVAASALWGWSALTLATTGDRRWELAAIAADTLRYAVWFQFLLQMLRPEPGTDTEPERGLDTLRPLSMLLPALSIGLTLALAWLARQDGAAWAARGLAFVWLALPVLGVLLVEQLLRNVSEGSRWGAKPLGLALGCLFVFDIFHQSQAVLFGSLDTDATAIRGAVHALVAPLLYVAYTRNAGWVQRLRLSPAAAFQSASLLLAGGYLLFVSAVGYYVRYSGGEWGRALQIGLLVLGLVLLAVVYLSGAVRARLRVWVGKHLFRYRYDYRAEWLRFTARLSASSSPQEVGIAIVHGLADLVESPAGSLWTRRPGGSDFAQSARWNAPAQAATEPGDGALIAFLGRTGWIVNAHELRAHPGRYEGLALPGWWAEMPRGWLVVPLQVGDELLGFVVLDEARTRVDVNWEVIDLLKTAGRQAASYLAQMHAAEALLEARKFDAFNRMSAFVVHDLKNIVTQLSLMMSNARRLAGNPEFQQDMLQTVESSLDKMRQLMLQLREGDAPAAGAAGVDLSAIGQRLAAQASARGRTLALELEPGVLTRGLAQRVERVVGHLVHNAFDATPGEGRVWMRVARASGQARIEVGDTGHGMTQDFIDNRLFRPFQSTKDHGMGIGSYESLQYIQELGGRIDVASRPGEGTRLTITLPLFEAGRDVDLLGAGAR